MLKPEEHELLVCLVENLLARLRQSEIDPDGTLTQCAVDTLDKLHRMYEGWQSAKPV